MTQFRFAPSKFAPSKFAPSKFDTSKFAPSRLVNFNLELEKFGLAIDKRIPLSIKANKYNQSYLNTKKSKAVEKFIGSPQDKDSVFNFTYDGAMQSIEDSLKRLG